MANALSRLRQGYGGPRDNAFHLEAVVVRVELEAKNDIDEMDSRLLSLPLPSP
jgi:hypothetical protein